MRRGEVGAYHMDSGYGPEAYDGGGVAAEQGARVEGGGSSRARRRTGAE
jgi:hypothetical protein